jgi:2-desacetyl-2-hydroxyethyl bacteriochlorophyllide A dehydrogenase
VARRAWISGRPSYSFNAVRQLVFHGPGKLSVEETAARKLDPGEVRLAVHSVGVCGSDVHGYAGVNARRVPGMVMGHEAIGIVEELGPGVDGPSIGTAVTVNPITACGVCDQCLAGLENICPNRRIYGCVLDLPGAYAESFVVRADNVVPFEGPAPLEWGSLAEPLAVGYHAVALAPVEPESHALVVGGGPIGLGAALAARRAGARVVVSEPNAHRRDVAERLGLETLDPTEAPPPAGAFSVAFECVGHSSTLAAALNGVPPRGQVMFVGLAEETIGLPTAPLMVGERRIAGSAAYTRDDFRATSDWIASGTVDLSPVIEQRVDLDGLTGVFDGYATGSLDAMKTVLQPAV